MEPRTVLPHMMEIQRNEAVLIMRALLKEAFDMQTFALVLTLKKMSQCLQEEIYTSAFFLINTVHQHGAILLNSIQWPRKVLGLLIRIIYLH